MSYIALANITLSSNQATVTFANIPTSVNGVALRDLVLIGDFVPSVSASFIMRVGNGSIDTGGNYSNVSMFGDGSSTGSSSVSGQGYFNTGYVGSSARSFWKLQFLDFSATDKHKTVLMDYRTAVVGYSAWASAGRWASTSAITTIRLETNQSPQVFNSGSTFALYGIAG
jgi:hypothetical protein